MASSSACAVGSSSSRVRLPAAARTRRRRDHDGADRHFAARGRGCGLVERAPACGSCGRRGVIRSVAQSLYHHRTHACEPALWSTPHRRPQPADRAQAAAATERARRPRRSGTATAGRPGTMRIAKAMARAGLCSRRDAERWIEDGRVSVNGEVLTSPARDVGPTDTVAGRRRAAAGRRAGAPVALSQAARAA